MSNLLNKSVLFVFEHNNQKDANSNNTWQKKVIVNKILPNLEQFAIYHINMLVVLHATKLEVVLSSSN